MIRPAIIALIARTRHRKAIRHRRNHPQLGLAVGLGAAVGVLFVVGSLPVAYYDSFWPEPGAYWYGTRVDSDPHLVRTVVREVTAVGIVIVLALSALTAVSADDWEHQPVELLTAVSVPTAAIGVLLDKLLENGWFVGPAALAGSVAFAVGSGSPLALVGSLTGSLALLATGLTVGTAFGLTLRVAIATSSRLYRLRYGVGSLALFLVFTTLVVSRTLSVWLAGTPLGFYGDLVLLTTPAAGIEPGRALGALALSAASTATALAVIVGASRRLWFGERVGGASTAAEAGTTGAAATTTAAESGAAAPCSRRDQLLEATVSRPTAVVVRTVWHRMRRSPRALLYVLFPLAIVGPATLEVGSRVPTLVPVLVALYGAGAVGMGTTLNPLGNERVALPLIRTTPAGPRAVLRGHAIAACLPGLPFVLALTVPIALVITANPITALGLAVVATALTVGGVGISLGVGSFLPNLEGPQAATLSPPELYAMFGYLVVMGLAATPAIIGIGLVGTPSPMVVVVSALTTTGLALTAGWLGYRYALSALERTELGA